MEHNNDWGAAIAHYEAAIREQQAYIEQLEKKLSNVVEQSSSACGHAWARLERAPRVGVDADAIVKIMEGMAKFGVTYAGIDDMVLKRGHAMPEIPPILPSDVTYTHMDDETALKRYQELSKEIDEAKKVTNEDILMNPMAGLAFNDEEENG